MKQRKCPFRGDICIDYGSCEDCTWCKVINKYEKRISKLQADNVNLAVSLEVAERDKANLERTIEEINEALSANGISIDGDGNVKVEELNDEAD